MFRAAATLLTILIPTIALGADGVAEINQACAITGCFPGDEPGFPVKITDPGSYRLTGNLSVPILANPGGVGPVGGIWIAVPHVTIDLNGFDLEGSEFGLGQTGILGGDDVSIMNGSLHRFRFIGIQLGEKAVLRSIRVDPGSENAITLGSRCRLVDSDLNGKLEGGEQCHVEGNTIWGYPHRGAVGIGGQATVLHNRIFCIQNNCLFAGPKSVILGNVITGDAGIGISTSYSVVNDNTVVVGNAYGISCSHCIVRGNVVDGAYSFGLIDSSGKTGYANNAFNGDTGGGPQVSGGIDLGGNVCGGDTTCP